MGYCFTVHTGWELQTGVQAAQSRPLKGGGGKKRDHRLQIPPQRYKDYPQCKVELNQKCHWTLFDHIPGHIVHLSDHVGKNRVVTNITSVTVLTAASTNQFQPLTFTVIKLQL